MVVVQETGTEVLASDASVLEMGLVEYQLESSAKPMMRLEMHEIRCLRQRRNVGERMQPCGKPAIVWVLENQLKMEMWLEIYKHYEEEQELRKNN